MGWNIERNGSTLHVSIVAPVGDWGRLVDDVFSALDPQLAAVVLPREIVGGSRTDTRLLAGLWNVLALRGLTIQRAADEPDREMGSPSGLAAR
jgi:hypothetical protein